VYGCLWKHTNPKSDCQHTEPEKQFALVQRHIADIQCKYEFRNSQIVVMVERNLGL
jgi:hypothetical protein